MPLFFSNCQIGFQNVTLIFFPGLRDIVPFKKKSQSLKSYMGKKKKKLQPWIKSIYMQKIYGIIPSRKPIKSKSQVKIFSISIGLFPYTSNTISVNRINHRISLSLKSQINATCMHWAVQWRGVLRYNIKYILFPTPPRRVFWRYFVVTCHFGVSVPFR